MKNYYETFSIKDEDIISDFIAVMFTQNGRINPWLYASDNDSLSLVIGSDGRSRTLTLSSGENRLSAIFSSNNASVTCTENNHRKEYLCLKFKKDLERVVQQITRVCEV